MPGDGTARHRACRQPGRRHGRDRSCVSVLWRAKGFGREPLGPIDRCYTPGVIPKTRYARASDGVSIAYQVIGDGPRDLVWVPGWISNVEAAWGEPTMARFFERLASFSRLILFDKRGTGLSDSVPDAELPSLETRTDDVRSVCDAIGSEQVTLLGVSEGAPMCLLFAATYPARTTAVMGVAIHIGARIAGLAGTGEILVSRTI